MIKVQAGKIVINAYLEQWWQLLELSDKKVYYICVIFVNMSGILK